MSSPTIIGKHPTRRDVPYLVVYPGEGAFVVGPDLSVKLDGIREVYRYTYTPPGWQGDGTGERNYLTIVRKGGRHDYQFDQRTVRDWTYQLIVKMIEGDTTATVEPGEGGR